MNQILKLGQIVETESGLECQVEALIGNSGQGEIYRATIRGDQQIALKWYFATQATPEQRAALETLIKKGAPNATFLWPIELASSAGTPGFGYTMPLQESRFKGFVDLMKRRIEPSFRALATVGLNLAIGFLQLRAKGLCFRDLSFGNVFFDPNTGDILIYDNNNITVDGTINASVMGTPRFMAPEVVRGEALPGNQNDLFSLAVMLFYLFVMQHPLEGKKEAAIKIFDLPAMTQLYGVAPVFIFDPSDESNRPVPGYHDNAIVFWPLYPEFLRDLFTRAFTDGLRNPQHGRVQAGEWCAALVRLRDAIVYCPDCSAQNFYDAETLQASNQPTLCWACNNPIKLPPRIRIGQQEIMLNHDTQLFPHHIDDDRPYDFSQPVAAVRQHPTNSKVWGLTNLSNEKWMCTLPDGALRDVPSGRSVPLGIGTQISFGKSDGEIQA